MFPPPKPRARPSKDIIFLHSREDEERLVGDELVVQKELVPEFASVNGVRLG
jgi:hypothetical protein